MGQHRKWPSCTKKWRPVEASYDEDDYDAVEVGNRQNGLVTGSPSHRPHVVLIWIFGHMLHYSLNCSDKHQQTELFLHNPT